MFLHVSTLNEKAKEGNGNIQCRTSVFSRVMEKELKLCFVRAGHDLLSHSPSWKWDAARRLSFETLSHWLRCEEINDTHTYNYAAFNCIENVPGNPPVSSEQLSFCSHVPAWHSLFFPVTARRSFHFYIASFDLQDTLWHWGVYWSELSHAVAR